MCIALARMAWTNFMLTAGMRLVGEEEKNWGKVNRGPLGRCYVLLSVCKVFTHAQEWNGVKLGLVCCSGNHWGGLYDES